MGAALLASRLLLAAVFLIAGAAKLADPAGSRRAVVGFGVPERLGSVVGTGLPMVELVVAVALIPSVSARFGALGALLLLAGFVGGIGAALRRGTEADCHCFGQLHSAPVGWRTLVRNGALAAVGAFVVIGGWRHPGVSATAWVGRLSGGWAAALGLGVVLVLVVGFLVWFSLQLLSQNGRIFARLEAIEAAIAGRGEAPLAGDDLLPALGAGLDAGGLPVGVPAPAFALFSTDGDRVELGALLVSGVPLLVVFSDAGCGPCDLLLPEVAGWQREQHHRLQIVLIASGDQERNREKAERHGLARVLLQGEHEVSGEYQAHGTPMAVVIGADGLIASPTVGGADAIRTLVEHAIAPPLAVIHMPSANGHGSGDQPPDTSGVGEPAPELVLGDVDGHRVALKELWTERTLAIFWNPGCGFCQSMLADLKAFEHDPPPDTPRLVVISTGDREVTREHELRSTVMLDPEGQAMNAFGAHGTPMGVLVENGRVASAVAAGADAVLALARAAPTREAGTARGEPEQSVGQQ
jgi:peroxiredoxin/thiol-disulfide isomerase/thioredoxin